MARQGPTGSVFLEFCRVEDEWRGSCSQAASEALFHRSSPTLSQKEGSFNQNGGLVQKESIANMIFRL